MRLTNRWSALVLTLLIPVFIAAQSDTKPYSTTKNKEVSMSVIERNKEQVRRLYEDCLNKKDLSLLQLIISAEYINDGAPGLKGPDAYEQTVAQIVRSFPDVQFTILGMIAEGDKVVVRWVWTGVFSSPFFGFPPTGKKIKTNGIAIFTIADGKIFRSDAQIDRLSTLQQMDVIPTDLKQLKAANQ